jgi:hypothetical protein
MRAALLALVLLSSVANAQEVTGLQFVADSANPSLLPTRLKNIGLLWATVNERDNLVGRLAR